MSCVAMIPSSNGLTADSFVFNEIPSGAINCQNTLYSTASKFKSGTLLIKVDGYTLDETNYLVGIDNQSFSLIINPADSNGLNKPLSPNERLRVDYIKDTATGGCVLSL